MRAIETSAAFDENGHIILDDIPAIKNKKVKLLILIDEEDTNNEFYDLSMQGLSKAYSVDEPEYDQSVVKEPNPEYKNERR
ncbi:MAG TPA: hypothetical protein VIM07_11575 [Chitinophagaceae bacterium]